MAEKAGSRNYHQRGDNSDGLYKEICIYSTLLAKVPPPPCGRGLGGGGSYNMRLRSKLTLPSIPSRQGRGG